MIEPVTIDTGGQCTGACCRGFILSESRTPWLWLTLDDVLEMMAGRLEAGERQQDDRGIWWDLIPLAKPMADDRRFTCELLTPSGRCGDYAHRPRTCREFPGRQVCHSCGFSVAKRRRAVRRFIRETKIARNLNRNADRSPYGAAADA